MSITKPITVSREQADEFKSHILANGGVGETLKKSLKLAKAGDECIEFGFDLHILSISGKICTTGILEFRAKAFGVEIMNTVIDISQTKVCFNPGIGGLAELTFCFSFEDNCLYTNGEIILLWQPPVTWREKIVCF